MYYIDGEILNQSNQRVTATGTVTIVIPGDVAYQPITINDGTYSAWTDQNNIDKAILQFRFNGYKNIDIPFKDAYNNEGIVVLDKIHNVVPWILALVVLAVYTYRKQTGKMGALGTADLMPIFILVGGVVAFDLIKKVLENLGIWDSQDTKSLDNAATNPQSFWNPNYWQTVKPDYKPWTYAITEDTAMQWAKEIYNAVGWINDDEEAIIAVFKRCRTKANCSFLAWAFQKKYGQDLLTWLRGGIWPQDRLSDKDVNVINDYISKLPAY